MILATIGIRKARRIIKKYITKKPIGVFLQELDGHPYYEAVFKIVVWVILI